MSITPLPIPFDAAFTVASARAAGIQGSRLRRHDLNAPFYATRAPSARILTHLDECRLLLDRLGETAFASHRTAGRIWEMPLTRGRASAEPFDLSVSAPARAPHANRVRGHSLAVLSDDITSVDGVKLTSPQRTWIDLAAIGCDTRELIIAGDHLARWDEPRCTMDDLRVQCERAAGRRGIRRASLALAGISTRSQSPRETETRLTFAERGLPIPEQNHVITHHGRFVARVDLAFPRYRVLVEYEGAHHRSDAVQWGKDLARFNALQALGWICIRIEKTQAADSRGTLRLVRAALVSRGWAA